MAASKLSSSTAGAERSMLNFAGLAEDRTKGQEALANLA